MKLNEIRIGNYFDIDTKNQPCPDRLENGIYQWDNWYEYYEFSFNENIFRPIPITRDWLRKADIEWMVIHNHSDVWTFRIGDDYRVDVMFIHEVQNLHYDLYKEELKYK